HNSEQKDDDNGFWRRMLPRLVPCRNPAGRKNQMTEWITPAPVAASRNGSSQRAVPALTEPALVFDLAAQVQSLKETPSWEHAHNSARTLTKAGRFRVVLTAMRAGAQLTEHRAA